MHQLKSQGLVRSRQGFGVFANAPPALAAQRVTRTQQAQLTRAMAAIDSATGAGELGVEEIWPSTALSARPPATHSSFGC